MAEILSARRGSVFRENVSGPQFMRISGVDGVFDGASVISTGFVIGLRESIQHIKVLTNAVYLYSFGADTGSVTINGMVFHQDACAGSGSISRVNSFYNSNRAYSRGDTAQIAIGGASFTVVLVGLNMQSNEGPFPFTRFSLAYTVIPLESKGGGQG